MAALDCQKQSGQNYWSGQQGHSVSQQVLVFLGSGEQDHQLGCSLLYGITKEQEGG